MVYSEDKVLHDYINIIISDLEKVGIQSTIEVVDINLYIQKVLTTFDWDCTLYVFNNPVFTEQWYNVWKSTGNLHIWYPFQETPATDWEARIDELYEELVFTYEEDEVKRLYDEFQQIMLDQLPFIPIFRKYQFTAVYKKWGNFNWDTIHSAGDDSRRLYIKKEFLDQSSH